MGENLRAGIQREAGKLKGRWSMATLLSVGLGLDSAPFIQEQRRINFSVRDLGRVVQQQNLQHKPQ
jgi:hypothetical protein